jgi:hypothetical protein
MSEEVYDYSKERRQPLAGISKPTFMSVGARSVGEDFAGLLYDMLRDIKACQLRQTKKCGLCSEEFDERYLKKVTKKVPLSWPELTATIFVVGCLVGLGVLEVSGKIDLKELVKLWLM